MNEIPLSKVKMYRNTNKILWKICLLQNSKYMKNPKSFYVSYASMKIKNVFKKLNTLCTMGLYQNSKSIEKLIRF